MVSHQSRGLSAGLASHPRPQREYRRSSRYSPLSQLGPSHTPRRRGVDTKAEKWSGYGPSAPPGRAAADGEAAGVWSEPLPHDAPDWVKEIHAAASNPSYADVTAQRLYRKLLSGTGGNTRQILERCQENLRESRDGAGDLGGLGGSTQGADGGNASVKPMSVRFRSIDNINLWLWVELDSPPERDVVEGVEEVITSWFILGKLGAYDAFGLHAHGHDGALEGMDYDGMTRGRMGLEYTADMASGGGVGMATAHFHQLGELQYKGPWCRIWVDIGNADNLCFDILINSLRQFSYQFASIRQVCIGGVNEVRPMRLHALVTRALAPIQASAFAHVHTTPYAH